MTSNIYTLLSGYGTWIEMSSTVTLLIRNQIRILFDTGVATEWRNLLMALNKLNLTPGDIDIVANTHLHMDHCENNPLFPNAAWFCSEMEYNNLLDMVITINAWPMDFKSIAEQYLSLPDGGMPKILFEKVERFFMHHRIPEKMLKQRRIFQQELNELGIQVIATPGHTDGHISFVCNDSDNGTDIIIAGDVIVDRSHFHSKRKSLFTQNAYLAAQSKQKLAIYHGWCWPGHGAAFVIPTMQIKTNASTPKIDPIDFGELGKSINIQKKGVINGID